MPRDLVTAVQRYYPQIYLACHVDHVRAASTVHRISARDSMLLSHLDDTHPLRIGELARHLGVAGSTLSAAVQRLAALGYVRRDPRADDGRAIELRLTASGGDAMAATSALDRRHVSGVLAKLPPAQRQRAVDSLALFARAASDYRRSKPARRSQKS